MGSRNYGFWLLFEKQDGNEIGQIIDHLADEFMDGKSFIPHLSIYPAIDLPLERIKVELTKIAEKYSNFSVETNGLDMSDEWSKTLFIKIKLNSILQKLNSELDDLFSMNSKSENNYFPHVSLIYNNRLGKSQKFEIINKINIPERIHIKSIAVVDPGVDGYEWREYVKWSIPLEVDFG